MLFRKNKERLKLIDEIIADLKTLRTSGFENQYAVEANIQFFEALKTVRGYIRWFRYERKKIDGKRLLELSDFPIHHDRWEKILQKDLLEVERWKFPDVLRNLRRELLKILQEKLKDKKRILVVSLGSGSMEIERQLILELQKTNSDRQFLFIGVDSSNASLGVAKENLSTLHIPIISIGRWTQAVKKELADKYDKEKIVIVLLKADALTLDTDFSTSPKEIDLLFYTRFKHHLNTSQKQILEAMLPKIAYNVIEHDDLNNLFVFTVPLILRSRWFHPILLNGAMFSSLRDPSKDELLNSKKTNDALLLYPDGYIKYQENA